MFYSYKTKFKFAKPLFIFCLFSLIGCNLYAQSSLKAGNKAYDKQSFVQAVKHYEAFIADAKASNKDLAEAYSKLGYSYKKLQDFRNSERIYRKLFKKYEAILDSKEYLYFAQVLASNSKYRESQLFYSKYGEKQANDQRAKKFAVAYMDISPFYRDSTLYQVNYLNQINSKQSDFSPMYYGKGLVYVSSRNEGGSTKRVFMNNQTPFLDLFVFPDTTSLMSGESQSVEISKISGTASLESLEFGKDLSSKHHDGPLFFFKGNNQILFTRNNFLKNKKALNNLKLFTAKYTGQKWDYVSELPFNSEEYSCGHPALNVENDKLYFISDMPGGFGGTDLYEVEYKNGVWGTPVNLGREVNSEGDEMFPFVDEFDNLYFASDGHPGLGGLDIFYVEMKDGKPITDPENLGTPINSSKDDFGLITNGTRSSGFFSSNRKNGYSDDNIYSFNRQCRKLKIFVYDVDTQEPLENAEVRLMKMGVNQELYETDSKGEVTICMTAGLNLDFKAFKEGYESNSVNFATMITSPDSEALIKIFLQSSKIPVVRGTVRSELTNEPIEGATVVLTNQRDKSTETVVTGKDGKYLFQPTKKGKYAVSVVKDKYADNTEEVGRVKRLFRKNDTYEQNLGMIGEGDIFRIENIYYDYGKHTIRKDARRDLNNRVLPMLKKYPQIAIEVRSHTDSRSSADYNQSLSELRAKEVAAFLEKKGIDLKRIEAVGYGETLLVNECADGVDCPEEKHQENRRTEFKILNVKEPNAQMR